MYISSLRFKQICFEDEQRVHQMLLDCFDSKREKYSVLYKKYFAMNNGIPVQMLLVYSDVEPVPSEDIEVLKSMAVEPEKAICNGRALKFTMTVAPTVHRGDRHVCIRNYNDRCEWVKKQLGKYGAEIFSTSLVEGKKESIAFSHKYDQTPGVITAYQYTGILRVTDAEKFISLFKNGLGRGKAYGCGLIQLQSCNG